MKREDTRKDSDKDLDGLKGAAFLDKLTASDPSFAEGSAIYDFINNVAASLRKIRGTTTQAELAERLGVTQGRISQIESGLPDHAPSLEMIARFALGCGRTPQISFDSGGSSASLSGPQGPNTTAFQRSVAPSAPESARAESKYGNSS
jgi:transcriptional regulator with XRE-family HTH domain